MTPPTSPAVPPLSPPAPPSLGVLRLRRGPHAGSWYEFRRRKLVIGRAPGCEVVLDHLSVAREHAVITWGEHGYTVADKGTLTGTYVNATRVLEPTPLHDGDEIRIGVFRLTFSTAGPPGGW